jgi:hypothetical protein
MSSNAASIAPTRKPAARRPPAPVVPVLLLLGLLAGGAAAAWFLQHTQGATVPAATVAGRWYGLAGTVLFAGLALYGARRAWHGAGLGRLDFWYYAHLFFGVVALAVLACHCGNPLRAEAWRSALLGSLQIVFWGTILTGVVGLAHQTGMKQWLRKNEPRPSVLKELDAERAAVKARLAALQAEARSDEGLLGAEILGDALQRAETQLALRRAGTIGLLRDWGYWEKQMREAATDGPLAGLSSEVRDLLIELNRIDVLRSYHQLLRGWTSLHLGLGVLGVQLVFWHVVQVGLWPR